MDPPAPAARRASSSRSPAGPGVRGDRPGDHRARPTPRRDRRDGGDPVPPRARDGRPRHARESGSCDPARGDGDSRHRRRRRRGRARAGVGAASIRRDMRGTRGGGTRRRFRPRRAGTRARGRRHRRPARPGARHPAARPKRVRPRARHAVGGHCGRPRSRRDGTPHGRGRCAHGGGILVGLLPTLQAAGARTVADLLRLQRAAPRHD